MCCEEARHVIRYHPGSMWWWWHKDDNGGDGEDETKKIYKFNKRDFKEGVDWDRALGEATEKQDHAWGQVSKQAQQQCIKAVVRLLVTAGTRKETLSRDKIIKCIETVSKDYKKHANKILEEAQKHLFATFGYNVITGKSVSGGKKTAKDLNYYVINNIQ